MGQCCYIFKLAPFFETIWDAGSWVMMDEKWIRDKFNGIIAIDHEFFLRRDWACFCRLVTVSLNDIGRAIHPFFRPDLCCRLFPCDSGIEELILHVIIYIYLGGMVRVVMPFFRPYLHCWRPTLSQTFLASSARQLSLISSLIPFLCLSSFPLW